MLVRSPQPVAARSRTGRQNDLLRSLLSLDRAGLLPKHIAVGVKRKYQRRPIALAALVRNLRDEALKLGQVVGDTGKPASDEDLKSAFDRLRVPPASRPALVKLWREVEGDGS